MFPITDTSPMFPITNVHYIWTHCTKATIISRHNYGVLCTSSLSLLDLPLHRWICFTVYKHVLPPIFFSNKRYVLSGTRLHLFLLLYQHFKYKIAKILIFMWIMWIYILNICGFNIASQTKWLQFAYCDSNIAV